MRRDSKLDPNDEILSPQSWPPPPYSRAGFMATWRDHRGQFILEWDLLETSIQSGQSSSRCCQYQCGWYVTQLRNPVCQSLWSFLHLPLLSSHHISQTSLFIKTLEAPFQAGAAILSGENLKRISPQFSCYCCYGAPLALETIQYCLECLFYQPNSSSTFLVDVS